MIRHILREWGNRYCAEKTKVERLYKEPKHEKIVDEKGRERTRYEIPRDGVSNVRKRLTIGQSLAIFGTLIEYWDVVQRIVCRVEGVDVCDPGNYEFVSSLCGLAGQCHTAATVAFINSIPFEGVGDGVGFPYEIDVVRPVVPSELRSPPPFSLGHYYLEADSDIIKPKSKEAVYIMNYRAQDAWRYDRGIGKGSSAEERIAHGCTTMLQRMIKMRGASIQESFVIAMCGYRCSECVRRGEKGRSGTGVIMNNDHVCLFRSSALEWMKALLEGCPEMPFIMTRDGVRFAVNCGPISSQMPLLIFEGLELMVLTGDGTISSSWEGLAMKEWCDRARVGVFSEMFKRRGILSGVREIIFHHSNLFRFYNHHLHVFGVSHVEHKALSPGVEQVVEEGLKLWHPDVAKVFSTQVLTTRYSDVDGRWLAVAVKVFGSALLYVMGATCLSLDQSAQGTLGCGDPIAFPRIELEVEGERAVVDWYYADPEVAAIREAGRELVEEIEPEYKDWEYGFFAIQTTNSAGNVKEVVDQRRRELMAEMGQYARLMVKIENTRILDTVQKIQGSFQNVEAFKAGCMTVRKAGERHQVGRRPRVIQMVGTEGQLPAFVLHNVLRPAYKSTPFTMSGKNAGDVRDMFMVLGISGGDGLKSSLDIKGMDSSTKPIHTNLSLSCVFFRLRHERLGFPALFLGSSRDADENFRPVQMRSYEMSGRLLGTEEYRLTYPQFVLVLGMMFWTSATRFTDGFFQETVATSRTVFRSGLLNTADQHTFLGATMYHLIQSRMRKGWYGSTCSGGREDSDRRHYLERYETKVHLCGGVLGDDQVAGVRVSGVLDQSVIDGCSKDICDETKYIMERLGYECEPETSQYTAEFLKQKGVCGGPELFPERLLLFTSERGDMAGSLPLDRTKIMLDMVNEKIGRARFPSAYAGLALLISWVCGTAVFSIGEGGRLLFRTGQNWKRVATSNRTISSGWRSEFGRVGAHGVKWHRGGLYSFEWDSAGTGNILLGLGSLWGCSDSLGVPFPPVLRGSRLLTPGTSVFTSPSNAMTHYFLWFCERERAEVARLWEETRLALKSDCNVRGFSAYSEYFERMLGEISDAFVGMKGVEIGGFIQGVLAGTFELPLELWFNFDWFARLGGFGSWIAEGVFKDIRIEREKYDLPRLRMWKDSANSLVPSGVRDSSYYACHALMHDFGIDVPSSVLAAERPGTKIDQALFEVKRVGMEDVRELEAIFVKLGKYRDCVNMFKDRLVMGLFVIDHVVGRPDARGPNLLRTGWGHTVRPNSLEAALIGLLDLPPFSGLSLRAIKERLFVEGKLPGDASLYVKMGRQALRRGDRAFQLMMTAMGLSTQQVTDLRQMIDEGVSGLEEARLALNPRKLFLFDASRRSARDFFRVHDRRANSRAFGEAMGIALLLMEPWKYCQSNWEVRFSHRLRGILSRR
ncbi:RdRp [Lishui pangolin virus]|nr:RdRp [Lishui pangolin virus]